jgi:hypothetical protein
MMMEELEEQICGEGEETKKKVGGVMHDRQQRLFIFGRYE